MSIEAEQEYAYRAEEVARSLSGDTTQRDIEEDQLTFGIIVKGLYKDDAIALPLEIEDLVGVVDEIPLTVEDLALIFTSDEQYRPQLHDRESEAGKYPDQVNAVWKFVDNLQDRDKRVLMLRAIETEIAQDEEAAFEAKYAHGQTPEPKFYERTKSLNDIKEKLTSKPTGSPTPLQ